MKTLRTAIVAATMMTSASAMAIEVSGNVALGSDYFFRGIDQAGGVAISGGLDVAADNGLYAGTWSSSINFSGGVENDYYVGYAGSFSEDVSYDVGYLWYGYPQGPSSEEFGEFYGSVSYGDATVGFAISDDYYASTGSGEYFYLDYGMSLTESFSLGFHYGTMSVEDDETLAGDDYSLTLSTEVSGLALDLSWVDHSKDSADQAYADNEFVLTISKSM